MVTINIDNTNTENNNTLSAKDLDWIGKNLNGCTIEKRIGHGASGDVYKAKDKDKEVAIKILRIYNYNDVLRFEREIKSLASISHPNIVSLLGGGDINDKYYFITMELFEAKGLNYFLALSERFPIEETIFIIKEVLKALSLIHQKGYVHRDLKPANILYKREENRIKVIDFGIAKKQNDIKITKRGTLVGTPLFMSPEQCRGDEADFRTDFYSLGVIFYCLLTQQHPFASKSIPDTLIAHISKPLTWSPSAYNQVPLEVREIIEKMVQKESDDRYQSAREILQDLQNINLKTI